MTDQLLRDGIDAFVVPMNKLLAGIEAKREAIVTGRPASFDADLPPELEQPVAERLRKAARTTSSAASGARTARSGRRRARPSSRTGSAG